MSFGKFGNMNGDSGILNSESQMIGYVVDGLEFSGGIDVLVTAGDTSKSITHFVFGRVEIAVTVLGVSKFILKFKNTYIFIVEYIAKQFDISSNTTI